MRPRCRDPSPCSTRNLAAIRRELDQQVGCENQVDPKVREVGGLK